VGRREERDWTVCDLPKEVTTKADQDDRSDGLIVVVLNGSKDERR
jgi:hypothetical protein